MCARLLTAFLLGAGVCASLEAQVFVFPLRGDQEVPPVASSHSGGCMGVLDQPASTFQLTCVHDVVGATIMHLHRGAAGENGPVLFDLGNPTTPVTATWTALTAQDVTDLLAGSVYLNIHTAGRPTGEIRGQVVNSVDVVSFTANGAQVVPADATAAIASCTADLAATATGLALQCTHDLAAADAAHVHVGPFGVNGPIAFTFPSAGSPLAATMPMTPLLVANYAATFLYLDVHRTGSSEEDPGAAIRGQMGVPPLGATTATVRIALQTAPGGATGFGFTTDLPGGPAAFTLDDGDTQVFSAVAPGSYGVVQDDPAAQGHGLAAVHCDDADSTGDPYSRTAALSLQAGEVVTCNFVDVAAPATATAFVFHLSGDQEVPPVSSPARGGCFGQFDAGSSTLTLVCVHDVVGPTIMHLHRGAAGANGAVLFDLGDPTSPVVATWAGIAPGDVADLLAGNVYVNIHTAGRPAGEIRGQVLARTVDTVSFGLDADQVVPPGTTTATGTCTADLDGPATSLAVQCTHSLPLADAAHVHAAPRGHNGPLVHSFDSAASPISEPVPMTPRTVADFAAGFLYVDVHQAGENEDDPVDSIRGQIAPPVAASPGTIVIRVATSPPSATAFSFSHDVAGGGTFSSSDGQTQSFTSVEAGTYAVVESDPASLGHAVSDVRCEDGDSTGDPFARSATVRLQPGETVVCTFTNALSPSADRLFVFDLSGAQEVPPVASSSRGGCFGQLVSATSQLTLLCVHDIAGATMMHVHHGLPGATGPVQFDLGSPASPVEATRTLTPSQLAALLAGELYVNVHTAGRPDGEIRGQLVERSVDNFAFPLDALQVVPPGTSLTNGTCTADLSADASTLALSCQHGVTSPTGAHLHEGAMGVEGPVAFTFPSAVSPFAAGVPTTPRLVADFAAGFLYLDVLRDGAEGAADEIRGQLLPGRGTVAAVDVPTLGGLSLLVLAALLAGLGLAWTRR